MATKPFVSKFKRALIVLLMLIIVFVGYVEIVNRNSKNMNYRQKVLKAVYPMLMWFTKLIGTNAKQLSSEKKESPVSFFSLKGTLSNGSEFDLATLKGKKVLLVNTASECGYTNQYNDLQKLHEQYGASLQVIGFPANDFKEQEKGTDAQIAEFCKVNFGVTFPLMKKSVVVKGGEQNSIFKWLTDSTQNGWNNEQPSWNFSKYLISEDGILLNYFGPSVEPLGKDIKEAINKK